MENGNSVGLYGKIPALGDFVSRNLPMQFTTGWDQWMQGCLLASQQHLGGAWLEAYLTSPVWRFALSAGVLGASGWAGVMIPSVDKVGRYYPFILSQAYAAETPATLLMVENEDWFIALEQAALLALQDGMMLEHIEAAAAKIPELNLTKVSQREPWQMGKPVALTLQSSAQNPLNAYPSLLHELLQQRLSCYSLWWSAGSEQVNPAQLITGYLPTPQCYTSFLAGEWQQWGWSDPFATVSPLAFLGNSCDN